MIFYTIRFKLTVWFALALTLMMLVSSLFWERNLARVMMENVDDRLMMIATEIESFHRQGHRLYGNDNTVCTWIQDFVHNSTWGASIQLSSPQGAETCTTQKLVNWRFPVENEAFEPISQGIPFFKIYEKAGEPRVRVLTYAIREAGRVTDILQIGKDLEQNEMTLADLQKNRLLYSPLLIAGVSLCSWFLAGWALAPVNRITAQIRKITAEKLNERLPVGKPHNELTELSITFNDMLVRLADSFQRIRQFTGDASHELRTPLAILKGETEVALRWGKGEEELRATLASNLEEIERMGRITEDLLSLAKSESGEFRLTLSEFSLNDLMQDLYLLGNTLSEQQGIQVTLWLNVDHEVFITADQMHLHRALLNLVSNALKYTTSGGKVELSLDLDSHSSTAIITVCDTGIGIPAENLPHIFERFYRVDEARNRSVGGTGLGLAIVKAIISAHQGTIDVSSAPGQGSSFIVRLPLAGPASNRRTILS